MNNGHRSAQSKRILLVDDDRPSREALRDVLLSGKHTVIEANNGAEAFGLFCQNHFDVVVTDYRMPFISGIELAARIRRIAPCLPIILISGYRKNAGPDNPVTTVLCKPLEPSVLLSTIEQVL